MMQWYKVDLGDAMLANEALAALKDELSTLYKKHGSLDSMRAVYRHESEGLHCKLMVYLTADFQREVKLEKAHVCVNAPLSDSGFLAGAQGK